MASELTIETPEQVYCISRYPVHIGRSADNDITIKSPFVADHHAVIEDSGQGLTIRSLGESHANGTRIRTTRPLDGNTLLQIGAATLKIWTDRSKPMPYADKKRRWWPLLTHPAAVFCWFAAAIALPMWDGYLDSPQSYIFDYNRFITLLITLLGITWIVHSMILPLSRRYLILPVLGIISAYSAGSDIVDSLAGWYGFQFNSAAAATCGTVLAYLGYLWLHRAFLRDHIPLAGRVLRRATLLTALPVTLLVSYAYLRDHDFFSQRPGSYPVYQSELGSSVLFNSQIKPIKNFFSIDKNEQ